MRKTVTECDALRREVLNREADIEELTSKVEACEQLIFEYQQAYADSCAYAVGTRLENIPVTSTTSVEELKSYIYNKASSTGARRSYDLSSEKYEDSESSQDIVVL